MILLHEPPPPTFHLEVGDFSVNVLKTKVAHKGIYDKINDSENHF